MAGCLARRGILAHVEAAATVVAVVARAVAMAAEVEVHSGLVTAAVPSALAGGPPALATAAVPSALAGVLPALATAAVPSALVEVHLVLATAVAALAAVASAVAA